MAIMLFIWCFVSTLAPYPMNSFFVSFFKNVRSIDIKNGKIWIQLNNTELDIGQALVEKGVPKEDIVIGFQPVYICQVSGYAIA
jgi:hypothetical protein